MLCSFVLIAIPIEEILQKRQQKNTIRDVNVDHERPAVKDDLNSDSGSTKSTISVKDSYDMAYQNDDY
uniref:Uncharacterized protein n=1 Tax=Acrobeloides nanus TaxID=290746 RepID=A0A914CUP5_9BILA